MAKKLTQWLQYLVVISPFVFIGAFLGANTISANDTFPIFLFKMGVGLIGLFISIIIHEVGHLLFGLLSGYQFSSFRIGNLMWYKSEDQLKLTTFSIPGTGGQCLMLPPNDEEILPYFWYNAGGGLFNLMVGSLLYIMAMTGKYEGFYLNLFAICNVTIGLLNLIPMNGLVPNDGYNLWKLSQSKRARKAFALSLLISDAQLRGVRIGQLDHTYFMTLTQEDYQNPIMTSAAVYNINRLLDLRNYDAAYHEIKVILNQHDLRLPELYRQLLTLEQLYFEILKGDFSNIESLYNPALKSTVKALIKSMPSASRFMYVYVNLYQGHAKESEKWLANFEKICHSYPYSGEVAMEREMLALAVNASPI